MTPKTPSNKPAKPNETQTEAATAAVKPKTTSDTQPKQAETIKTKEDPSAMDQVRKQLQEHISTAQTLLASAKKQGVQSLIGPLSKIASLQLPFNQPDLATRNFTELQKQLGLIKSACAVLRVQKPSLNLNTFTKYVESDLSTLKGSLVEANPALKEAAILKNQTRKNLSGFQESIEAAIENDPAMRQLFEAFPGIKMLLFRLLGFKIKNPVKGSPEAQRPEIKNIKRLKHSKELMDKIAKSKDKLKFVYFGNANVSEFHGQQLAFDLKDNDSATQLLSIHKHVVTPGKLLHIIGDNEKSPNSIFLETLIKTIAVKKNQADPLKLTYQQLINTMKSAGLKTKEEPLKDLTFDAAKTLLSKIPCTNLTQDKVESKAADKPKEKADTTTEPAKEAAKSKAPVAKAKTPKTSTPKVKATTTAKPTKPAAKTATKVNAPAKS